MQGELWPLDGLEIALPQPDRSLAFALQGGKDDDQLPRISKKLKGGGLLQIGYVHLEESSVFLNTLQRLDGKGHVVWRLSPRLTWRTRKEKGGEYWETTDTTYTDLRLIGITDQLAILRTDVTVGDRWQGAFTFAISLANGALVWQAREGVILRENLATTRVFGTIHDDVIYEFYKDTNTSDPSLRRDYVLVARSLKDGKMRWHQGGNVPVKEDRQFLRNFGSVLDMRVKGDVLVAPFGDPDRAAQGKPACVMRFSTADGHPLGP